MRRDIKVAAISIPCPGGQPDRMVDEVRGRARLLSMEGVEVLCLPEACLTGYSLGPEAEAWAQPLTAPRSSPCGMWPGSTPFISSLE